MNWVLMVLLAKAVPQSFTLFSYTMLYTHAPAHAQNYTFSIMCILSKGSLSTYTKVAIFNHDQNVMCSHSWGTELD